MDVTNSTGVYVFLYDQNQVVQLQLPTFVEWPYIKSHQYYRCTSPTRMGYTGALTGNYCCPRRSRGTMTRKKTPERPSTSNISGFD